MSLQFESSKKAEKYDQFARLYDWVEGVPDLLGVSRLRHQLLRRASGNVLEVAVGTGKNLRYYPQECRIVAVDISGEMLNVARKRAEKLSMNVDFLLTDAQALPFCGKSCDTVLSSLTTCPFPNPRLALRESPRVCKPTGRVLWLDHARSHRES